MEDDNQKAGEGDVAAAAEIVAFFRSMSAKARDEYEQLAERDRRFGEDSKAEMHS